MIPFEIFKSVEICAYVYIGPWNLVQDCQYSYYVPGIYQDVNMIASANTQENVACVGIQCGQQGIARPRKPGQSNGCKYNQSEYE